MKHMGSINIIMIIIIVARDGIFVVVSEEHFYVLILTSNFLSE